MRYDFLKKIVKPLLALSLLGLLLPNMQAENESLNGVKIKLLPGLGGKGRFGYQEHVFLLLNISEKPRTVVIAIEAKRSHYSNYLESLSRTVTLPPGAEVQAIIPQPPLIIPDPRFSLRVNGQYFDDNTIIMSPAQFNNFAQESYFRGKEDWDFLVSQSIPPNANGDIFSMVPPAVKSSGTKGNTPRDFLKFGWSNLPVEQWSSNWLAYTAYRAVMVTAADLDRMPPAAAEALQKYAASGGTLIVFTTERKEPSNIGFGSIVYYSKTTAKFDDSDWTRIIHYVNTSAKLSRLTYDNSNENMVSILPVMENVKVPVRQLFLIMLLFFFIIGPLNIYILHRKKKMIWILWTTPVIAVAFALLVISYSLLAEGWHTRARNNTLTILDENTQLAATLGIQGFYCPLSPRGGLNYADSASVMQFNTNATQGRTINWSNGQNLASGWLRPRIPAYFFIRQVESRRERLKVNYANTTEAEVVNGTGALLKELKLAGPNGTVYVATGEIQPGQKAILKATGRRADKMPQLNNVRKITEGACTYIKDYSCLDNMLTPGTYCAKMEKTPFLPPGIKPGELIEESLIFGILPRDGGTK